MFFPFFCTKPHKIIRNYQRQKNIVKRNYEKNK